mmetsp:Transcript_9139/g.26665  ORF Transcript_9139/g.26665 Transcript_9139/m.26665 type:complete len:85 (+) Transcript_9139:157-411(+)
MYPCSADSCTADPCTTDPGTTEPCITEPCITDPCGTGRAPAGGPCPAALMISTGRLCGAPWLLSIGCRRKRFGVGATNGGSAAG